MLFETDRWQVRLFEETDIKTFMDYRNNLEWMKYQNFKGLSYTEYANQLLAKPSLYAGIQYAVIHKKDQQLMGDLFLVRKKNTLTIGYTIHPTYANQGYMSDIIKHYVAFLRQNYLNCEIVAMIKQGNIHSKKLLINVGFRFDVYWEKEDSEIYVYYPEN